MAKDEEKPKVSKEEEEEKDKSESKKEDSKNLKKQIQKSRKIKETSLKTYLCALKTLKKKIEPDKQVVLLNTDFLQDYDKVMKIINQEKRITSKKNKLTAILVALNSDDPKNTELIDKYGDTLKKLSEKYLSFLKRQEKTDTQKENWLDYNDLINIINKIMREVKARDIGREKNISNRDFDLLQQLVILRTYIAYPLRNDFADMKILQLKDFKKLEADKRDDNNFLVLRAGNKKEFHINQFKNKKFLGAKVIKVSPTLNRVINLWLKHNKSGWYLVKKDRTSPMTPNGITKFLNKIFIKHAGKKISTSMIRHIVISHMLKDEPSVKEKEEKAKAIEEKFLHSKDINDLYRKVDKE